MLPCSPSISLAPGCSLAQLLSASTCPPSPGAVSAPGRCSTCARGRSGVPGLHCTWEQPSTSDCKEPVYQYPWAGEHRGVFHTLSQVINPAGHSGNLADDLPGTGHPALPPLSHFPTPCSQVFPGLISQINYTHPKPLPQHLLLREPGLSQGT